MKKKTTKRASSAVKELDKRVYKVVQNYSYGAFGAMVAIPLPGADMAATFAVWGKMIVEIAKVYGYRVKAKDASRLASDLFKGVILTSLTWFASAKVASTLLKFIPGAGTLTAYALDAVIAAFGAKRITAGLGFAAAAYYKSGRKRAPRTFIEHIKNVLADPSSFLTLLGRVLDGTGGDDLGIDEPPDLDTGEETDEGGGDSDADGGAESE